MSDTGRAPGSRSRVALLRREIADLRREAEERERRLADTNFLETEALLAVMACDAPKAAQLLEQMLPGELRELMNAAKSLTMLANRIILIRQGTMP